MNKLITFTLSIIISFFSISMSFSEDNYPNTSIAIIDLNLIFSESNAAKDATKQYESIQKNVEKEIVASDKDMLDEKNKLIEQKSVIAPEAFELKAEDYEKKLQNYQIERQNKLRKLDGIIQKARSEILANVSPILESISKEIGVTVILEKNTVLLSANNMDITSDVIKRLNKVFPKIKVSLD